MKVKVNQANTDVATVKYGECFWFKGLLYMRIVPDGMICDDSGNELVPSVLLTTGKIHWIAPDTQVEKYDCVVVSSDMLPEERGKFDI